MQVNSGGTSNLGPKPVPEQKLDPEPHAQPWARFEETVAHIVRIPLELIQKQIAGAAQDLNRRFEELSSIQRHFEDDVQKRLAQFAAGLVELQDHTDTTSAVAARDLAVALGTRLDVAVEAVKQDVEKAASRLAAQIQQSQELRAAQVQELTSQVASLRDPLGAIKAEVRAMEGRTNARQDDAVASLREAIGKELSESRRSSDADQALARGMTHLRRASYAILALLTVLAAGLLTIAIAG
jgi:archaellum component FlaC